MVTMDEYITERLRELDPASDPTAAVVGLLDAADEIEKRDNLLEAMQEFLRQNGLIQEFQSTLDFEERVEYEEFFGLDEDRDPFIDLEDLYDEDDDNEEW